MLLALNTLPLFDVVEEATGLPLSKAVADLRCGEAPARVSEG